MYAKKYVWPSHTPSLIMVYMFHASFTAPFNRAWEPAHDIPGRDFSGLETPPVTLPRQLPCLCSLCPQSEPCREAATRPCGHNQCNSGHSDRLLQFWAVEAKKKTQFSCVRICHRPPATTSTSGYSALTSVDIRWPMLTYVPIQPSAEHWEEAACAWCQAWKWVGSKNLLIAAVNHVIHLCNHIVYHVYYIYIYIYTSIYIYIK